MKHYAVIDTNVLVSAMLKWDSVPGNIMELAFSGPVIPVLNEEIFNEYREVLLRPKFHLTEDIVNDVLAAIDERGVFVDAQTLDSSFPIQRTEYSMKSLWKSEKTRTPIL